ncbi:unnamed protein product [Peniophora sp. CBMAI 1063]|nr:unnamed protein product [Peniophora sp. CBMAI 1063]
MPLKIAVGRLGQPAHSCRHSPRFQSFFALQRTDQTDPILLFSVSSRCQIRRDTLRPSLFDGLTSRERTIRMPHVRFLKCDHTGRTRTLVIGQTTDEAAGAAAQVCARERSRHRIECALTSRDPAVAVIRARC